MYEVWLIIYMSKYVMDHVEYKRAVILGICWNCKSKK